MPPGATANTRLRAGQDHTERSTHADWNDLPPLPRTLSAIPSYTTQVSQLAVDKFNALPVTGKAGVAAIFLLEVLVIFAVIRLGTHGILEYLYDAALWFSSWPTLGPLLLIGLIAVLSFPPLIGYGTSITLCGLAYGTPLDSESSHGLLMAWLIASAGCLTGSTLVFLFFRRYLSSHHSTLPSWINKVRTKREWLAMEKAVQEKGYRMILLIRFCPFPFVYSNLFFASLQSGIVTYLEFLLATIATTPKLFLHVFIGAKTFQAIRAARGGEQQQADDSHSWISLAYVVAATLLGVVTSWYIYKETKRVLDEFMRQEDVEEGLLDCGEEQPQEEWDWSDDEQRTEAGGRNPQR